MPLPTRWSIPAAPLPAGKPAQFGRLWYHSPCPLPQVRSRAEVLTVRDSVRDSMPARGMQPALRRPTPKVDPLGGRWTPGVAIFPTRGCILRDISSESATINQQCPLSQLVPRTRWPSSSGVGPLRRWVRPARQLCQPTCTSDSSPCGGEPCELAPWCNGWHLDAHKLAHSFNIAWSHGVTPNALDSRARAV